MPLPEDSFVDLAGTMSDLVRRAVDGYAPVVGSLISDGSADVRQIERTLDGLLDFCFDGGILRLYKRLCRYYHGIDPAAAAFYARAYREMWGPDPDADP
jgi:hypothetical protein